jgi:hypothetical protein
VFVTWFMRIFILMFLVIFLCAITLIQNFYNVFSMAFYLGDPCKKTNCGCVVARFMDYDHILSYNSTWSSKVTQLKVLIVTHIFGNELFHWHMHKMTNL